MRFPVEMPLRDTRLVTVATRMRGFMIRCRRGTVTLFADEAGDRTVLALFVADLSVAGAMLRIRPDQAISPVIGKNDFAKEALRLAYEGTAAARVSVVVADPVERDGGASDTSARCTIRAPLQACRSSQWSRGVSLFSPHSLEMSVARDLGDGLELIAVRQRREA